MKRGYYRDPRLGGGWFRDMIERSVAEGKARVVWTPETGWSDNAADEQRRREKVSEAVRRMCSDHSLDRWHDDGGCYHARHR